MPTSLSQKIKKLILVFGLGSIIALMSGCALSPEARSAVEPKGVRLKPGEGLVALKISSNHWYVDHVLSKWGFLHIRNVETKAATTLFDRSDTSASHSQFIGALPPGIYEIESVTGEAARKSTAKASDALPRFRVSAGQLTNLGSLVTIRKLQGMGSSLFWWGQADSPFDDQAVLRQLEPTLAKQLSTAPVNSWDDGEKLNRLRQIYAGLRSNTMRALSPVHGPDGTLYLGESFGQIATRRPSGVWQRIETPTALTIRAIHVDASEAVYAGSDDALLMVRRNPAGNWERIPLPVTDGSVIYVGKNPISKQLLVVLQTRDSFIGLDLVDGPVPSFKELFSRPRARFTNTRLDEQGVVLVSDGRIVVAMGREEGETTVGSPDSKDGSWKFTNVKDVPIDFLSIMPGGGIGRFNSWGLGARHFGISLDGGVTWDKRGQLAGGYRRTLFVSSKTGYTIIRTSNEPAEDEIWRTDDAGHTWTAGGRVPGPFGHLVNLSGTTVERIGFALPTDGLFFVSSDGGKIGA